MGLPISLILIAVGAVLTFAVNDNPNRSVDIDVVGWILMAVGLVGLLLSLLWWERFGPGAMGWRRGAYGPGEPAAGARRGYGRRRTVVEDDMGPPPDEPPPL